MTATVWESVEGRYDKSQKLIGEKQTNNHAGCLECSWSGPKRKPTPTGAIAAQADADSHNETEHPTHTPAAETAAPHVTPAR